MRGDVNFRNFGTIGFYVLLLLFITALCWGTSVQAQELPPDLTELSLEQLMNINVIAVNVLGTHTHFAGEFMVSYRFMFMRMDGNRDGTNRLSVDDIIQPPQGEFKVTPTDMDMQMSMLSVMYAPTDNLTLMAMLPYIRLSMDHVTRTGVRFTTKSQGIGDLTLGALYIFHRIGGERHRFIFKPGLSFPTGSIDEKDDLPTGPNQQLPYPMQLGSGTFDLLVGISYLGVVTNWGWGVDLDAMIRLGENDRGYTLGNRYLLALRLDRRLTDWLSSFVRVDGRVWNNIDGADSELDPTLVSTADPKRRGGERADFLVGLSMYVPGGAFERFRFAVEGGVPFYQSLDGPQLETDWLVTVGAQFVF